MVCTNLNWKYINIIIWIINGMNFAQIKLYAHNIYAIDISLSNTTIYKITGWTGWPTGPTSKPLTWNFTGLMSSPVVITLIISVGDIWQLYTI